MEPATTEAGSRTRLLDLTRIGPVVEVYMQAAGGGVRYPLASRPDYLFRSVGSSCSRYVSSLSVEDNTEPAYVTVTLYCNSIS